MSKLFCSVETGRPRRRVHSLSKKDGPGRKPRRRCTVCYRHNRVVMSSRDADRMTKQVITFCEDCPGQPFMCLPCFNSSHK
ncbi:hypothetical protein J6590_002331 [Homalodisca vitripennis]|nr:hypothetical protein J6590_002331 [Homalodisca vitripennis]